MTTALYTHLAFLLHETAPFHPETAERLKAIWAELEKPIYEPLLRIEAGKAPLDAIKRVHSKSYIEDLVSKIPQSSPIALDDDTFFSPKSFEAALYAAGAVIAAVDAVMDGTIDNAFCAVRPPGHHATHARAMGFCLFNNVAIGAAHAIDTYGFKKVAIVDFDVHHGNGTQDWADQRSDVLFLSSHQSPLWPGTGSETEKGAFGNIVNLPLAPEMEGASFCDAWSRALLPKLDLYAPEFIFISAGFDAHEADPLASLHLREEDFGWLTKELKKLSIKHCQGRLVSVLEGGYNLEALAKSVGAHVLALKEG